jgi:hypothetical protein
MPQYTLLIYGPSDRTPTPEEMAAEMPRWNEYTEALKNGGLFVAGEALHGPEAATTVRVRDAETQFTDGPFAETKETLGGFYVIDCPDLDTALKHAARMPNIAYGSVEVRPVVDFSAVPSSEEAAQATA